MFLKFSKNDIIANKINEIILLNFNIFGVEMFGERLKKIRKNLTFTQDKISFELGMATRTYASYERDENNPPYSMLLLLLQKYNVNLNWFVSGEGQMFNAPKFEEVEDVIDAKVLSILRKQGVIE